MKITRQKHVWLIAFLLLLTGFAFAQNSLPFTKGVNLRDYFTTWDSSKLPDMYRYDEADFVCMKSMGIDVIRLVTSFDYQMEPEDTGKIREEVLKKLDEVCDLAEKHQIYLIIDNHSFGTRWDLDTTTPKVIEEHLTSLWSQLAPRYKDRSEYIIYEIQNEPGFRTGSDWNKIQQRMIDLIRTYDTKHAIIVSPQNFSAIDDLLKLKPYKDPNLIYTIHFYEPAVFCHQGEDIAGEGSRNLLDLAFPYDKNKLPKYQGKTVESWEELLKIEEKTGSWFYWGLQTYPKEGNVKFINDRIKKAAAWAKKNKVRLFCGEIGSGVTTRLSYRAAWNKAVSDTLKEYNIPYCTWGLDYGCGFLDFGDTGIEEAGCIFPDDINKELVESYGFSMPDADSVANTTFNSFPQKQYIVFDGICGKNISFNQFGNIELINEDDLHGYCLKVKYTGQSGTVFFPPKKIISAFAANREALCISFSVKFTDKNQTLVLHLNDTDEGSELPPWQNTYTVKASDYKTDQWVTVGIPVSKFKESGAWSSKVNQWFDPQGKFDWFRFEGIVFEIKSENDITNGDVYIDDIVIKKK